MDMNPTTGSATNSGGGEPAKQHGAKTMFWYLGLFLTLSITAFATGAMWFQFINKFFPTVVTDYGVQLRSLSQDMVKNSIAAMIVGTPVFFLFSWLIRRGVKQSTVNTQKGVRLWISYLILFIVVAVALGDLIASIFTFLNGDFTTRFLLKSLAILVIAGWIFTYFWLELRSNDALAHSPFPRLTAIITAVVVIASIAGGFFLIDSPQVARAKSFDQRRVNDLSNIRWQIDEFYRQNKKMPSDLNELNPYQVAADPKTNEPYQYEPTGEQAYQLCANFETSNRQETKENRDLYPTTDSFIHDSGQTCFDFQITENDPDTSSKPIIPNRPID